MHPSHPISSSARKRAAIDVDRAVIELRAGRCHLQAYGIVHGGVLATLIDTATFWSVYLRIPEDAGLVNIDLKLNYLLPVENGLLAARGRAIRSGIKICYPVKRALPRPASMTRIPPAGSLNEWL